MNNDLISRSALKEDFKARLADCNDWIEKAKDKETKIRASAIKAFISEVIMTIDNAPTVEEISVIEFKEPLPLVKAQKIVKALSRKSQGEWINHRNDYGHNIADCSLCGKAMQWHDEDEDGIPRYCWYCGAKMKGGKFYEKGGAE